jgi:tripartite-type tricarboxylate transporter receptor subunit TctC
LFGTTAQISVVPLVDTVHYDPQTSFIPVSIYGGNADILAVAGSLPVSSVAQFIAYAKAHSDDLTYGSGGVGSIAPNRRGSTSDTSPTRAERRPWLI